MQSDKEIAERIAQLTGAINQHKNSQPPSSSRTWSAPAPPRPYFSAPPARFSKTWTPGQGNKSVVFNKPATPTHASTLPKSYNKKLVLNGNPSTSLPPVKSSSMNAHAPVSASPHKKLVLNNASYPSYTASPVPSPQPPPAAAIAKPVATNIHSPKQVVIDGVKFIVKGRKLIREDRLKGQPLPAGVAPGSHVRVLRRHPKRVLDANKNMVLGQAPKRMTSMTNKVQRSKKGNMVLMRNPEGYVRQGRSGKSLVLKSKREVKRYCGLFTRYGKCPKGTRCAFLHDINHRAICPKFLQDRCKKPANLCNLSHTPTPQIMPHCVHFQRGHCTKPECSFMHVRVRPDAPVCRAFAMEGYCSKGLQCHDKHIHVCPEFAETGKCSNANCRLPHVARRTAQEKGSAGVVRPRSWTSAAYEHAQKKRALDEKRTKEQNVRQAVQDKNEGYDMHIPKQQQPSREEEEEQGFVRLFDDSNDDEGWSLYASRDNDLAETEQQLRFDDDDDDSDIDKVESDEASEEDEDEDEENMVDEEYEEYEIAEDDDEEEIMSNGDDEKQK